MKKNYAPAKKKRSTAKRSMKDFEAEFHVGERYDMSLPNLIPFMWVEAYKKKGDFAIIAYGAYNAMGLIGSEKGGVAVVDEKRKQVLATIDIPWNMKERSDEFWALKGAKVKGLAGWKRLLRKRGYGVRDL